MDRQASAARTATSPAGALPRLTHRRPSFPPGGKGGMNEPKRGHLETPAELKSHHIFALSSLGCSPGRETFPAPPSLSLSFFLKHLFNLLIWLSRVIV